MDIDDPSALLLPWLFQKRILLLEDQALFADPMIAILGRDPSTRIDHFTVGEAARDAAATEAYDILLLDRINPGLDGLSVLRAVRDGGGPNARTPILMVTSLGDADQRIAGLTAGADDYVPKPVSELELLARVAAALRRAQPHQADRPARLSCGPLGLSEAARTADFDGVPLTLTPQSFAVLKQLMHVAGQPISKTMLFERCWPEWTFLPEGWENTIYKAIDRLRTVLAEFEATLAPAHRPLVVNVRGQGYMLRDLNQSPR